MARQQPDLEAQELKDEAKRCQLELKLLEQEDLGDLPASDAASVTGHPALAAPGPLERPRDRSLTVISVERTRQWLVRSQHHGQPGDTSLGNASSAPEPLLQRPIVTIAPAPPLQRLTDTVDPVYSQLPRATGKNRRLRSRVTALDFAL